MKIGDFAKACGVPVSVLRFYDSEGLLKPVYIDSFTGYRYYTESQMATCNRIGILKSCGFTLAQIKDLLECDEKEAVDRIFEDRKQEIKNMLLCLDETREIIMKNEIDYEKGNFPHKENIDLPFENDEAAVGRWEIVSGGDDMPCSKNKEVYFLQGGEGYWCYSGWTKGFLLLDDGYNTSASPYSLEYREDGLYMIVKFRYYDCWEGREPEIVTLKKLDNKRYGRSDICIIENTDMPFKNDEKVLGKWVAHDFISDKADFSETIREDFDPYFKAIEFLSDGECVSVYDDEIIGSDKQCWTKGYLLRKFNSSACAYEIKRVNGKDYLIIEWKSGDYRWGGLETDYYVFVRS